MNDLMWVILRYAVEESYGRYGLNLFVNPSYPSPGTAVVNMATRRGRWASFTMSEEFVQTNKEQAEALYKEAVDESLRTLI